MRGFKKLLAIILVASLIFTSNASFIFAEGNQNENESILEPSSDNLSSDDSSFDGLDFISTSSNINSLATNSELTENDDEENSSNQEYAEEPEDDNSLGEANETSSTEASTTETSEEESSDESSIETTDSTDSTDSTNASTTSTDSSENDSTNQSSIDNDSPSTPSEIVDAEESNNDADATTATESEMSNENHSVVNNGNLTSTISEINEIIVSTNSELRLNEEIFGAGEWVWWIVDDSDPDNITINYYGTEPADYSTIESSKKGKTSGSSSPSVSSTYKPTIKTAIFVDGINARSCNSWFNGFSSLTTVTNLSNIDSSAVTSMQNMFKGCTSLTNIDLTGLEANQVTNMSYMFDSCTNLQNVNASGLANNHSTNMSYMFRNCSALQTVNITGIFSNTVVNIDSTYMFQNCTSLSTVDFSNVNMSTVSKVSYMFDGCNNLTNIDLSNSNASAITSMSNMFKNCSALTSVNLTNFGSTGITSYSSAFEGCQNIRNLNINSNLAAKINNTKLLGNWKKSSENTVYEYTSNKTTIPAEAGEYVRVFKLTFDCKGGNVLAPVFKEYNGSITLGNPARPGFTFDGWYNEEAYTNQITSPYTITGDKTIYAKWSGGEGATLVYWRLGKKYSYGRTLYLSMQELPLNSSSYEFAGSFANTADFNSETDVPWHAYRSDIYSISTQYTSNSHFKCKSIAYWFKDMTRIKYCNISSLTNHNDILESAAHVLDGCINLTSPSVLHISNAFKNMNSAFKNCNKIKYYNIQRLTGAPINSVNVELENNGFKDTFAGCTSLRRLNLRDIDFSNYTGDVFSFAELTNLVRVRVKNSGNLFNRVNLIGEWWEHDSGQKYTSANMPTNVRQIRKYETFSNTIYWYIQGSDVHLSSTRPSNSNYKEGHYFNGDEANTYGMLPLDVPDNNRIVLDNTITLRNSAGSCFFTNISDAIEIVNLNRLNTSEVTEMDMMFDSMQITNLDLSSFNTSKVSDMNSMFAWCENLTTLDLSSFNTSKVTDMSYMFDGCTALTSVRLNSFDTKKVEIMYSMFEDCSSLTTLDLSSFDSRRLEPDWDYNEDAIDWMFLNCSSLRTIYVSENFRITCDPDAYTTGDGVFTGCTELVGGNGTTYNSANVYANYARIDSAGSPGYFTLGGQGYIAPTNGGGNSDDGGSSSDDSGNNSGNNGGSSSGSSGGSGGGGGGSIAAIDNQINNMMNALNLYTPATTQVSTTKSINNNNSLNGDTSSWAKDPVSGKWKLTAINANGQSVNASNGFFQINSTVTQNINNTQVNSIASSTYYFDQSGNMVTGWVQTSDNKWYFFDNIKNANEGKMVTGWRVVGNNWYYFTPDGSMLQSGMTPDGYIVGADGAYIS